MTSRGKIEVSVERHQVKPEDRQFEFFAYPIGDVWVATCEELGLRSYGESQEGAVMRMFRLINKGTQN
jgi:hypothetical protein